MGIRDDTEAIRACCTRLAEILTWDDARLYVHVPGVSRWSPAQQVEHVAQAGNAMLRTIARLEAGETHASVAARGAPSLVARVVLLTGRIPRGMAQAPDHTVPDATPTRAALEEAVRELTTRAEDVAARAASLRTVPGVGRHPVLGWFSAAQWWRFLRVHTQHHLAIVADLDRHGGAPRREGRRRGEAPGEPLARPT